MCLNRLAAEGKSSDVDWERLPVGGLAEGSVHEVKEYGIVCDLEAHPDLVGVATHEQVGIASADCNIGGWHRYMLCVGITHISAFRAPSPNMVFMLGHALTAKSSCALQHCLGCWHHMIGALYVLE